MISSKAKTTTVALLEAVIEAGLAAKNQGFHHVLFPSDNRNLLQSFKKKKASDWLDSARIADLIFLSQNGFYSDMILVPHVVVNDIWSVGKLATRVPMQLCWFNPDFSVFW